ncbi:MAG: 3'(2'),5'-bisphosphate nucleotidase CysQ family protein [Myxococcota bacterium]
MLDRELRVACVLAQEAGAAIEGIRAAGFKEESKSDRTPVTEADLASDRILRRGLLEAFPEDSLLSEESENHVGGSCRTWIIDPLDGTRGFINDVEGYAVQIGLVVDEAPVLGVVYEPRHGRLYFATRGHGATLREGGVERLVRVSPRDDFSLMTMVASSSLAQDKRTALRAHLGVSREVVMRSVGSKVGALVRQNADIYVSSHPVKYWDSCGPLVILEEAGGVWTHLDGSPLSFSMSTTIPIHGGPFLVSNGHRHAEACQAAQRILVDQAADE